MEAPQIILLVLWAISFGIAVEEHGRPRSGRNNAWASLIGILVTGAILWWGGFWD